MGPACEQLDFCRIGDFEGLAPVESAETPTFVYVLQLPAGPFDPSSSLGHARVCELHFVIYNDAECPPLTGK